MAAPGKNKLENVDTADLSENLFPQEDDDFLSAYLTDLEEKNKNETDKEEKLSSSVSNHEIVTDEMDDKESFLCSTPLQRFRPKYLCVSDLTQQDWCEQQLFYKFTVMVTTPELVEETPVMVKGSEIHMARELEVHDIVTVKTSSREDQWAIKILNTLTGILGFLNGISVAREVPIFGRPFDQDIFVYGIIDELRFDGDAYTIDLKELKTKLSRTNSPRAQQRQHAIQVMMYKRLFDDMVQGKLKKDHVKEHLNLDLDKEFGEDVAQQLDTKYLNCKNLSDLLDVLFQRMQCLTCINQLFVEYVHQESRETLALQEVTYDENHLCNVYTDYLKFWKGQRSIKGVDIEEAWKCQKCDFESICEWRKKKSEECQKKNALKNNLKYSGNSL